MAKQKPKLRQDAVHARAAAECELTCGDSVKLLAKVPAGSVQLVVADPNYNIGQAYDSGIDDNKPYEEYLAWSKAWMAGAARTLAPDGSMWIFVPEEWTSELDMVARHDLGLHKRRTIVWAFTFGQAAQRNFTKSYCNILYYTKTRSKFAFNEDVLRVPSARQLRYNDKRANPKGKLPDATWMLLEEQLAPHMGPDRDVWLESRVCGTYKERQRVSPNQLPLQLVQRIVLATSSPGRRVLDPFLGTGTTAMAAVKLGRSFTGFDLSRPCIEATQVRLQQLKAGGS